LGGLLFGLLPSYAARVSPAYALLKLGIVLLVAAGLAVWLEGRVLPALLRKLSSETLFLYVSHVLLLYAGHVGLAQRIGRSQSLAWALLWTACLLLACAAGALGYRRVQRALRGRGQRGTPRAQPTSFPG
jgi:cytochrome bd-type quinol oxidase subunit 2